MTEDHSQLTNFVNKFSSTVKFGNDHVAKIMGYGDYQIGNVTNSRVYFVEGLGHNLFFVRQFCDLDLEVAFRQHTCFIRNLEGVDLLTRSRGNNLYTLSLGGMIASSPICLLSKTSKTKSWLWHRRLSYLNFGAINHLARQGLVLRLPKLKFEKDHLCSACAMGKVKCLRSKDEAPNFIIKFLKMIQVQLKQNGVVERRNRTLIKATHTVLMYAQALLFLWAKAVAITCYTQNHSIVRLRRGKTPYDLLNGKLPDISFLHVFGALCYPTNDNENLGKLQPKDDIAPAVIAPITKVINPEPAESTGLPSSITVDQDAPSPSKSQTIPKTQPPVIPNDVEEDNHDNEVAHMAMQEELNEFKHLKVWELVPRPDKVMVITLKCIYKVKLDELGEEVYVSQSDGFVDPDNPNHVYKLKKALYGLKGPRAWYDMLSSFLISQDFSKGLVDLTLFIRRNRNDLLLVQIYVDDIIFAASTPDLCDVFAKIMCLKFKMSMMGKLLFLLGLQISQSPRGIFINLSKYSLQSLKKYGFESCDLVDTPMVEKSKLDEDKEGKAINPSHYSGMIGTLLYLTAIRHDLQFAICMCPRYQAQPTEKHLHAVKRIFRYLRGTVNQGLWYLKDSSITLTAFADANHAGCQDTRRSTSGSLQFLGDRLISWSSKRQKSAAISSTEAKYIALSKHIDIKYHFIKEHVENGVIELYFVNTEYQLADIFTKSLGRERIEFLINKLGMRSFTPETMKQLMDEVDE
nr:retrovirus-related Pol polyprotein from transposon TNT 1-94 [Tanacetum cinerariifolium]